MTSYLASCTDEALSTAESDLRLLEQEASTSVANELLSFRGFLQSAEKCIHGVDSDIARSSEDANQGRDAQEVTNSITCLHKSTVEVISLLESAHGRADAALKLSKDYRIKVMQHKNDTIAPVKAQVSAAESVARSEYEEASAVLSSARSEVRRVEAQAAEASRKIRAATVELEDLRPKLKKAEEVEKEVEKAMETVNDAVRSQNRWMAINTGAGLYGVGCLVVGAATGGMGLPFMLAGAAAAGTNAVAVGVAHSRKKETEELREQVLASRRQLQDAMGTIKSRIDSLEDEERQLNMRLFTYRAEVSLLQSRQSELSVKLSAARSASESLKDLMARVGSLETGSLALESELQAVKQRLDECTILLCEHRDKVGLSETRASRLLTRPSLSRSQQLKLMGSLASALKDVKGKIPKMLAIEGVSRTSQLAIDTLPAIKTAITVGVYSALLYLAARLIFPIVAAAVGILFSSQFIKIVFAIILPPLAVVIERGFSVALCINFLLTVFGYLPGVIHSLYIILNA